MRKIVINGPCRLEGEVEISGGKNAIVAILPATVMVRGKCTIENVPQISDVTNILEILRHMGASIKHINSKTLEIDCTNVQKCEIPYELARRLRASYYFLSAMLGRWGEATVAMPGGCSIGLRPIDQHIKGFERLGAKVDFERGNVHAKCEGRMKASHIYFDVVSVGATINVMMAAATADGMTVMENVAKEPHIVDVANFLNSMGANISGAGTDVIKVRGVAELFGGNYAVIPDQIEAGTFMVAAAATRGDVTIKNVIPKHLECISRKLTEMNVDVIEFDDYIRIIGKDKIDSASIKTMPYPGFPTDMQPQMAVLMAMADGTSRITENIWESRFKYVDELRKMGASISVIGNVATIEGGAQLLGAPIRSCDLRAGAAMIIAGLTASGTTEIEEIEYIERGYENIIEKFRNLGADIRIAER
ncbi:MAG: UDP-N-acetylglucosamine 1-carboxyvinyltransferase [Clostridia bacterium]|nr:UDP-N-acetylglucosamine 1-carboxyvinyltransferase [Clostridia bacterium]